MASPWQADARFTSDDIESVVCNSDSISGNHNVVDVQDSCQSLSPILCDHSWLEPSTRRQRWRLLSSSSTVQTLFRQSEQLKPRSTLVSDDRSFVSTKAMEPFVVQLHDKVDLICPQYKRETLPNLLEFSIIYMVDKVGYESCSINSTARLVGLCTVPYKKQVVTVVFRRFTPNPGGLEFVPNRRYYLITTSTGKMEGMQNTDRGLCYSKNMRLQFDVKEENYQPVESKNKLDINRASTKPFIIWDQPNHRAGENARFTAELNFAHNNPAGNDVYWSNSRFTAPKHRANAYRPARLTERLSICMIKINKTTTAIRKPASALVACKAFIYTFLP
ncbi:ephrin-B2 [Trichinella spiralis]|uniref:ephrin-B2 n=1 Tax=Trichinella spiralis TaxID=6334 RepID=UPI0001EFB1F7|nr:ephrin-B2 [Trichinella spiralis]